MGTQIAAQSSVGFNSKTKYRYDIFLSFRGEDTRYSFTVFLYEALRRKGINAFIDDKKLGKGEEISPTLLKAIEKSRISIIVFSRNYANSTWCLEELAHIIWCKNQKKQVVMPIFYKVDPLDVQYQRNSFREAMDVLKDRFRDDLKKVRKWRSALREAASLSLAWLFQDGNESVFITRVVEDAYAMLPPKRLHSPDYMVGLEPRIKEVMSLLNESGDDSVCMLGIHGTGGIGKTTLAKAVYNSIFYQFEGSCFLFDVKEASQKYQGIVRLQQTLLSEILDGRRMKFCSADEGISRIKHSLSHKKVLLVLDDVDESEQLEHLAGSCNWFGSGSKIIITTRNKHLLIARNVEKRYEMMSLNGHDSMKLFCWHAFHMSQPPKSYQDMSSHVINYAQGLPLALRVIGSNLKHRNPMEWRSTLEQYDRIPEKTIQQVLKISYDCLQDDAKRIFLDIACFFKNEALEYIKEILDACGFGARFYIEVLVDKSLIIVDDIGDRLCMHDLIQQMGREIVRQEAPSNLGKRSRLWYYEDVLTILRENLGSSEIEGIMLEPPQQEVVLWSSMAFENMNNLRILIIRNAQFSVGPKYFPNNLRCLDWEGYPSETLPPDFSPKRLVFLKLWKSPFRSLEEPFKRFEHVTYMNFSYCEFITEIPDVSQCQSLRTLLFESCQNLIKVHDTVGSLSKLVELNLNRCTKLTIFPQEIKMPSLQVINLTDCKSLIYFPHIVGNMDSLMAVYAEQAGIKKLPSSIGNLQGLKVLSMKSCKGLKELPSNLFTLKNLSELALGDTEPCSRKPWKKSVISCTNLESLNLENWGLLDEDLHLTLSCFRHLRELSLSGNDFVSIPGCIKECVNLEDLLVNKCKSLRDIPELPPKLENIEAENCTSLSTESLGRLWSQVKKEMPGLRINMPATTFPEWFHDHCDGATLCFRARENFPHHIAFAFQLGHANQIMASRTCIIHVSVIINGRGILKSRSHVNPSSDNFGTREGHVFIFDLEMVLESEEWERLDSSLELDWNDVEIRFQSSLGEKLEQGGTAYRPDDNNSVVKYCGVYAYTQQINMENLQFNPNSLLSMNASRTSLKRRAMASPPPEPHKKLQRKFEAVGKGKVISNRKKGSRRKRVFPIMGKHVWRFLRRSIAS